MNDRVRQDFQTMRKQNLAKRGHRITRRSNREKCEKKQLYVSFELAHEAAQKRQVALNQRVNAYKCWNCGFFHIGKKRRSKERVTRLAEELLYFRKKRRRAERNLEVCDLGIRTIIAEGRRMPDRQRPALELPGWRPRRAPDVYIGGPEDPYLLRWYLIPRNRFLNIYIHEFRRSDDDSALHDHPWPSLSVCLAGTYVEHTIEQGGIHRRERYTKGAVRLRSASFAHRIEVNGPCRTLFITGPKVRDWGFHTKKVWVPWRVFVGEVEDGS